jgi:hypothetical protein
MVKKWSEEEIAVLITAYYENKTWKDIQLLLPHKRKETIYQKARSLGLEDRPEYLKTKSLIEKNKERSRDLSIENVIEISKKYKTKSQFRRSDISAYQAAQKLGILDKLDHMAIGT